MIALSSMSWRRGSTTWYGHSSSSFFSQALRLSSVTVTLPLHDSEEAIVPFLFHSSRGDTSGLFWWCSRHETPLLSVAPLACTSRIDRMFACLDGAPDRGGRGRSSHGSRKRSCCNGFRWNWLSRPSNRSASSSARLLRSGGIKASGPIPSR